MRCWIGQRIDDLQLLDDRAGPPVCDDERQRILVLRAYVDEVDVEPVDLGDEVRQGLESRLALAPVVIGPPIARELLRRRKLDALRGVRDVLLIGPPVRVDAPAQVRELRVRNDAHLKRTNRILVGTSLGHGVSFGGLSWSAVARPPRVGGQKALRPNRGASRVESGTSASRVSRTDLR